MGVTRDWIPKQIDKFKIFADNLCDRASVNALKWHLIQDEIDKLILLQKKFNIFYKITSVKNTYSLVDTQNTRDARKTYQKALRNIGIIKMKMNNFMTDTDKMACGINIATTVFTHATVVNFSPIINIRKLGELNMQIIFINPQTNKVCKPKGQAGMMVTFGFYKKGNLEPTENECTYTLFLSKSFSNMVFPESAKWMMFVGFARYINTRKKIGTSATQFFGVVS